MNTNDWERVLEELRVPFLPEIVAWKPQTVSRDRRRSMAVPYVETQPYQERLDKVCPEWQDDYAIWFSDPQEASGRGGEKRLIPGKVFVKCRLTIGEHTRADVGECELTDENALTSAKAQAFKRACAAFGLGRYLYDLPRMWVDFDEEKGIPDNEIKKLEGLLRLYANGGSVRPVPSETQARPAPANGGPAARPLTPVGVRTAHGTNGYAVRRDGGSNGTAAPARNGEATPTHNEQALVQPEAPAAPAQQSDAAGPSDGEAVDTGPREVLGSGEDRGRTPSRSQGTRTRTETAKRTRGAAAVAAPAKNEAQPAPAAEETAAHADEGHTSCPLHNVPLQLVITREGKTLLLHKVDGPDGGYCNGEVVRPAKA